MATAHPGKWELILEQYCLKDTVATATDSAVVQNPITKKWYVIFYLSFMPNEPDSRLWDPVTGSLTPYLIPPWPGTPEPPNLFCGGLCMQPDGNVIECGGFEGQYLGYRYTYMFKFNTGLLDWEWVIPETGGVPHLMANGRWYPSIVTLGEGQGFGKFIAMSGYRGTPYQPLVVNDDPEIYDPVSGWSMMADPLAAKQPFTDEFDIYVHGFVIPAGPRAGKLFYPAPNLQAYVFNPFASGVEEPYWTAVGAPEPLAQKRKDANSVLIPLKPPYDEASFLLMGGARPDALNTCKFISLMGADPQWQSAPSMNFARSSAIAIILPTDEIILIGGSSYELYEPVYTPELLNPTTERGNGKCCPPIKLEEHIIRQAYYCPMAGYG